MTSIALRRGLPIVSAFLVLALLPCRSTAQTSYLVEEAGDANGAQLGRALAAAGDLNGDGYVDFVVGEPQDGSIGSGRVHVYLGGASPHKEPLLDLGADLAVASFGRSLAGGRDVNGDGHPDVLVGAQDAAYVYFGGPAMDNLPDLTLDVPPDAVDFGAAVTWVRDLDGDGFADAVVGAPGGDGHAYVFKGSGQPDAGMDLRLNPSAAYPTFGTRVISADDVNGDGYDDLLIGEPRPDATGAVFLYFGGASPDAVPDLYLTAGESGDQFGSAIAAGDLNADGYSDVIVGLPHHSGDSGKVVIYMGGPLMDNRVDIGLVGEAPSGVGEQFGAAVDCTGDVNGDGFPDLLVGAPFHLDAANRGRACLFFGGSTIHQTADRVLTNGDAWFGISVARAGDVDADGRPDLLVGAPQYNDWADSSCSRADRRRSTRRASRTSRSRHRSPTRPAIVSR